MYQSHAENPMKCCPNAKKKSLGEKMEAPKHSNYHAASGIRSHLFPLDS